MKKNTLRFRLALACGMMILACLCVSSLTSPVTAQQPARPASNGSLAPQRWEIHSLGLSFYPPAGAQVVTLTGDDAILRISHPTAYRITVYTKESTQPLTLDQVVNTALKQAMNFPTPVRQEQPPFATKLGTLDAGGFTYSTPDSKPPVFLTQIFTMLSPTRVLMFELNATASNYAQARAVFDQMLTSVIFKDPQQLAAERKEQLDAGHAWLSQLDPQVIHKALAAEQWFRLTDSKNDIGYMRVRQTTDTVMNRPGIRVDIQARIIARDTTYDTLSNFFATDAQALDERNEVWSVRTTVRTPQQKANQPPTESSWAETGLLSRDKLSVTRQNPNAKEPFEWDSLPAGYLSQAHAQLLPMLLKPDQTQTLAFYSYNAGTGKVTIRTERVTRDKDGSYQVHSRLSPEQDEQITWFSPRGKLLKRVLPGGHILVPATASQIQANWRFQQ